MVKRQIASTGQFVEVDKDQTQSSQPQKSADKPKVADTIHVKIYSPFKVYFDDEANSISAENDTGPFDVLPKHHRFLTLLNPGDIIVRVQAQDKEKEQRVRISRGIMHVRENRVTVFLDV